MPELDAVLPPDDPRQSLLAERIRQSREVQRQIISASPIGIVKLPDAPVFIPLGNDLTDRGIGGRFIRGTPTIACPVFEDEESVRRNVERLKEYDVVVCASAWNRDLLGSLGVEALLCHEGIDPVIFHPGVKRQRNGFRVFSGGKAEYRKGQDLVIEAFKRFAEAHDDAVLVAAWGSPFGQLSSDFEGKCPWGAPPGTHIGKPNFGAWLQKAGLRREQYEIVSPRPNWQMAEVYGSCDVALFPNRCEGGTNFVAMECMACGVPTAISLAYGMDDLFGTGECVQIHSPEDAVERCVDAIEDAYCGVAWAATQQGSYWTWERHCKQMAEIAG
jgi:glycosyltransferase involved in cell wall biosynthesis